MLIVTSIMGVLSLAVTKMMYAQLKSRVQASGRTVVYHELSSSLNLMAEYLQWATSSAANTGTPDALDILVRPSRKTVAVQSIRVQFEFVAVGNKVILTHDVDNNAATPAETLIGGCPFDGTVAPPVCPPGPSGEVSSAAGICPIQLLRGNFGYFGIDMTANDLDGDSINEFGHQRSPVIEMFLTGGVPVLAKELTKLRCEVDCAVDPDMCVIRSVRTMVYAPELYGLQGGGRMF